MNYSDYRLPDWTDIRLQDTNAYVLMRGWHEKARKPDSEYWTLPRP
jgi:hypothetical protein